MILSVFNRRRSRSVDVIVSGARCFWCSERNSSSSAVLVWAKRPLEQSRNIDFQSIVLFFVLMIFTSLRSCRDTPDVVCLEQGRLRSPKKEDAPGRGVA